MSELDFVLELVQRFGWPTVAIGGIVISLLLWVRGQSQVEVINARADARIVEAMAKQLDGLQSQVEQMSRDLSTERALNLQLRTRIETLEFNVTEMRATVANEQARNLVLQAENSQLTQQITALKAQGCT